MGPCEDEPYSSFLNCFRAGSVNPMFAPFDIFQTEPIGNMLWRGCAASLEEARVLVRELGSDTREDYVILSQRTGNRSTVRFDGTDKLLI
jgi:hypothetical protein